MIIDRANDIKRTHPFWPHRIGTNFCWSFFQLNASQILNALPIQWFTRVWTFLQGHTQSILLLFFVIREIVTNRKP